MEVTPTAIFHFCLAFMIIFANVTVSVALRLMKTAKKTTVIFLADLAISNMIQGVMFLVKSVFFIWHVNTKEGCLIMIVIGVSSTGAYTSGIFLVYLDLYLSLKRMSVGKGVISTRFATQLVVLSWLAWFAIAATAYGMQAEHYAYDHLVGCSLISGAVTREYQLFISLTFVSVISVITVFHVMTYRLIRNAKRQQERTQATADGGQPSVVGTAGSAATQKRGKESKTSRWVKKNDAVLKMILLILIMFVVCWYPPAFLTILVSYCKPCTPYITKEVVFFTYILIVIQYNSNAVIYLIKIKEFQNACRNLCCRCCPGQRRVAVFESESSGCSTTHPE